MTSCPCVSRCRLSAWASSRLTLRALPQTSAAASLRIFFSYSLGNSPSLLSQSSSLDLRPDAGVHPACPCSGLRHLAFYSGEFPPPPVCLSVCKSLFSQSLC